MHAAAVLARSSSASAFSAAAARRLYPDAVFRGGGRNSIFRTKNACGSSLKKLFRGAALDPARADVPARSNANTDFPLYTQPPYDLSKQEPALIPIGVGMDP